MRVHASGLLTLPLFVVAAAGCSGGGGGAGLAAVGPVTSSATGRASAYGWSSQAAGQGPGERVAALAPTSGGVFGALAPARQVSSFDATGAVTGVEGGFLADVRAFAAHAGALYAAAADAASPGAGDVWQRTASGWVLSLDGPGAHAVVAEAGGRLQAVTDDAAGPTVVHALTATGWLALGALPAPETPTAAGAFGVDLFVGTEGPSGAGLFRVRGNVITRLALPALAPGPGARQRVTALIPMPEDLVVAVGTFDATSGQALGGQVLLWHDPVGLRPALGLVQDAPLALCKQDGTLYVGTAAGRLLYQAVAGGFMDEPGLPGNRGVHALLALDPATLLVGVAGATGPEVLRRVALSAPTPGGAAPGGTPDYLHVARPILAARCAGCHGTLQTGWRVSAGMSDDAGDYQATLGEVDAAAPAASLLLTKATNRTAHSGGALLPTTSPEYAALLGWVQAGAPFDAGSGAGTPGAGPPGGGAAPGGATPRPAGVTPDYLHEAKAILAPRCSGCHSTTTTGWRVSTSMADDTSDYQATLAKVSTTSPAASLLLTKATNQAVHSGGALLSTGSPEYATLLSWIQSGARFDTPRAPGSAPTPSVPTSPKYVADVKPILFGCVGCHQGESPRLSAGLTQDSIDYQSVLREVSLSNPSGSGLLRRPSSTNDHPVKVFDVGSIQYDTLLRWIQQDAPFN